MINQLFGIDPKSLSDIPEHERLIPYLVIIVVSIITGLIYREILKKLSKHDIRIDSYYSGFYPILIICLSCLFYVLKSSIMLSIGLLGALSIIRFRTIIRDIRETIMILSAIVLSLLIGTAHFILVGLLLTSVILILFFNKNVINSSEKEKILSLFVPTGTKTNIDELIKQFTGLTLKSYTLKDSGKYFVLLCDSNETFNEFKRIIETHPEKIEINYVIN